MHCNTYQVLADGDHDFYSAGSDGLIKIAISVIKINLDQGTCFHNWIVFIHRLFSSGENTCYRLGNIWIEWEIELHDGLKSNP